MAGEINTREKKRIRRALTRRDGFVCFYCGISLVEPASNGELNLEWTNTPYATLDHVKPRSMGGTNEIKNLVLSCRPCHVKRHE